MSEPLVVVGNGMAAARFVEEMAKRALGRYAIAVVGDEPRLAYNRVLLSSVLSGEVASEDIELRPRKWWRDRGVTVSYGCAAERIDHRARVVHLANGVSVPFSKLVLATGSSALRLNIPGADLAGVMTFRDSRDVEQLMTLAAEKRRVVVIGGGLLGLEAAYGLAKGGASVTLLHLMDRLMERQLDASAAALLKHIVEQKRIRVMLGANTARIIGEQNVRGVELADGRTMAADAVVFAAGIRPNVGLANDAGVSVNRGIVVDDRLCAGLPDIYALGECAEHRGVCYGLVEPAYEQAAVLADHLAGGMRSYQGSVTATNLKVSGVNVFSAGDFDGESADRLVFNDARRGIYKKLVIRDNLLAGAVLVGDTQDALWYLDLIRSQSPLSAGIRERMMFGRELAERKAA